MSTNPIRPSKPLNTRRSQRLLLKISVVIAGQRANGSHFVEQTSTEVVNAHGALILLSEPVASEQLLRMKNVKAGDEEPCKVVGIGQKVDGKTEIGVEFLKPSPRFWRIAFPPDDWTSRSPEAKRFGKKNEEAAHQNVPVRQAPSEKR